MSNDFTIRLLGSRRILERNDIVDKLKVLSIVYTFFYKKEYLNVESSRRRRTVIHFWTSHSQNLTKHQNCDDQPCTVCDKDGWRQNKMRGNPVYLSKMKDGGILIRTDTRQRLLYLCLHYIQRDLVSEINSPNS